MLFFLRFKEWTVNSGRSEFLLMDPCAVHSKYLVCDAHFEESSFTNHGRNRLKHNAIPQKNVTPIVSDSLKKEYYLNLTKWKGNS